MNEQGFHYRWEWRLKASPEGLWPLVADTNRFNHDTSLPGVQHVTQQTRQVNARRRLRFHRLGVRVEWEEEPFEWIRPYRFGVVRHYTRGPVAEMSVQADLTPLPDGGTHLVYQTWAWPKGPLGSLAIPVQIGWLSARDFDRVFRQYGQLAAAGRLPLDLPIRVYLVVGSNIWF